MEAVELGRQASSLVGARNRQFSGGDDGSLEGGDEPVESPKGSALAMGVDGVDVGDQREELSSPDLATPFLGTGGFCHHGQMPIERPAWGLASGTAWLVALPLALATSALLLPGDPDDPNVKVLYAAAVLVVPSWMVAALVGFATVRAAPQRRRDFMRALGPTTALATSVWLLLFAWPIAAATPPPETKEQVLAAQQDPHLWAPGAWRMVGTAVLLAVVGLLVARRRE